MRSPFPGMDPYLGRYGDDVPIRLCTHVGRTLQQNLPRDRRANDQADRDGGLRTTRC